MFGVSLFDECINLINEWQPKQRYKNELNYRDDLMNFLNQKLNHSNDLFSGNRFVLIKKEDGRGLCDIAVGNRRVGIELKKDLKSKSQINRLQGQIDDYAEDYQEGVIVVLVGNTDEYIENELRYKLRKKLDTYRNPFDLGLNLGANQFKIGLINKTKRKVPQKQNPNHNPRNPFDINIRLPF